MTKIDCGTYHLAEVKRFRRGCEVACWYTEIEVQPGYYPVRAVIEDGRVRWFLADLHGIVTDDYYPALWCGMPISREPYRPKYIGNQETYTIQAHDYEVMGDTHRTPDTPWRIDYAVLPHIGACVTCGCPVTVYDEVARECATCMVAREGRNTAEAKLRWPRLIRAMESTWEWSHIAAQYVGRAALDNDAWARGQIKALLPRARRALKRYGKQATCYVKVDKEGRVTVDGKYMPRLEA